MHLCCFALITSEILQLTNRGSYDGYFKHKRNNQTCDPWDSQGTEKKAVSISIAFSVGILFKNENMISEERKTKPFEIILKKDWVKSPQSWKGSQN